MGGGSLEAIRTVWEAFNAASSGWSKTAADKLSASWIRGGAPDGIAATRTGGLCNVALMGSDRLGNRGLGFGLQTLGAGFRVWALRGTDRWTYQFFPLASLEIAPSHLNPQPASGFAPSHPNHRLESLGRIFVEHAQVRIAFAAIFEEVRRREKRACA